MNTHNKKEPILQLEGICKSFPGVQALKGVDFSLWAGEVRGLVGGNGAGKSTLMNVLGGVINPDVGKIIINGQTVTIDNPAVAEQLGVSFIHQELSLFENMDIATNIFIQHLPQHKGVINYKKLYEESKKILDIVGLSHRKPSQAVSSLSMGERQLVEIARCLSQKTKILVLDEPTSSLTSPEIQILFKLMRDLKEQDVSIVFISHRFDEVYEICDNITIMRDGTNIATKPIADIEKMEVVRLMIGRELSEMYDHERVEPGKDLLEVKNLTRKNAFSNISFKLRAGEVIGLYGLLGSGRTELVRSIFGLDPFDNGEVYVEGKKVQIHKPGDAIKNGIALITEDRRGEGLVIDQSVQSNLVLANLSRFSKKGIIMDAKKEQLIGKENINRFKIATSNLKKTVGFLSGGNQQKVVIAKWINTKPSILILDEPTRGIDVGAKKEIYKITDELLKEGVGVFLISSELPELLGMCDRIIVIKNGREVAEFGSDEITNEKILYAAMGVN